MILEDPSLAGFLVVQVEIVLLMVRRSWLSSRALVVNLGVVVVVGVVGVSVVSVISSWVGLLHLVGPQLAVSIVLLEVPRGRPRVPARLRSILIVIRKPLAAVVFDVSFGPTLLLILSLLNIVIIEFFLIGVVEELIPTLLSLSNPLRSTSNLSRPLTVKAASIGLFRSVVVVGAFRGWEAALLPHEAPLRQPPPGSTLLRPLPKLWILITNRLLVRPDLDPLPSPHIHRPRIQRPARALLPLESHNRVVGPIPGGIAQLDLLDGPEAEQSVLDPISVNISRQVGEVDVDPLEVLVPGSELGAPHVLPAVDVPAVELVGDLEDVLLGLGGGELQDDRVGAVNTDFEHAGGVDYLAEPAEVVEDLLFGDGGGDGADE